MRIISRKTKSNKVIFLLFVLFSNCIPFQKSELDPNSTLSLLNLLRLLNTKTEQEVNLPTIVALYQINRTGGNFSLGVTAINPETGETRFQNRNIITHSDTETSELDFQFNFTKDFTAENFFLIYKDFINLKYVVKKFSLANQSEVATVNIPLLATVFEDNDISGIAYNKDTNKLYIGISGGSYTTSPTYNAEGILYILDADTLSIENQKIVPLTNATVGTSNAKGAFYLEKDLKHLVWQRVEDSSGYNPYATIISTEAPYEFINTIPNLSNTVLYSPLGGSMIPSGMELLRDDKNKKYYISNLDESSSFFRLYSYSIENFDPTASTVQNFSGPNASTIYNNLSKTFLDSDKGFLYHVFQNGGPFIIHKYNSQTAAQQGSAITINPGGGGLADTFALAPGLDRIFFQLDDPTETLPEPFLTSCKLSYVDTNTGISTEITPFINENAAESLPCTIKRLVYLE